MAKTEMSMDEIVVRFRQAKDKAAQVAILAELNDCTPRDIIQILKESEIDGRSLSRIIARYCKRDEVEEVAEVQSEPEQEQEAAAEDPVEEEVNEAMQKVNDVLLSECSELKEQIKELEERLAELTSRNAELTSRVLDLEEELENEKLLSEDESEGDGLIIRELRDRTLAAEKKLAMAEQYILNQVVYGN